MPQEATVRSVTQAYRVIKQMRLQGWDAGEECRAAAREAVRAHLRQRMLEARSQFLADLQAREQVDRANGSYERQLLTEMGTVLLQVPRTRSWSAAGLLQAYRRRSASVDRAILGCFLLGLSTRKVARALLPMLGERISAATVSNISKSLDAAVTAFHRRPIRQSYRVLVLDGVVLARKTGAGAVRRPVLVALGIRHDERKEIIDFRQAQGESTQAWEAFLNDLYRRGLSGEGLELICSDGGTGLRAALPLVYPHLPVQLCWAHKARNVLDKVRRTQRPAVKRTLRAISHANGLAQARSAAARFVRKWENLYPRAVACLRAHLEDLLHFFAFPSDSWRAASRTTNAIERRFREVRRRTRPMGVMADRCSVERILYSVFSYENLNAGTGTPLALTHNS
jgi:transposase-like protein